MSATLATDTAALHTQRAVRHYRQLRAMGLTATRIWTIMKGEMEAPAYMNVPVLKAAEGTVRVMIEDELV